jgi:hypothetical protein
MWGFGASKACCGEGYLEMAEGEQRRGDAAGAEFQSAPVCLEGEGEGEGQNAG